MNRYIQSSSSENAYFHRFSGRLTVAVIVAGFTLSLAQFLFNRSLWWDEAAQALNIIHRNSLELLQPLDHAQVAPVLFLQIQKLFSILLPDSEYGLRLFPLLCFWLSVYFFLQILKKQINSPYGIIVALSLLVFSYRFLFYASEAKRYMPDVLTALCMFYLMLKSYKNERNRYVLTALAGAVAVFISGVAPVILFTCGACWAFERFFVVRRGNIFPMFAVFAVWLGVFGLYYATFIHNHPLKEFMVQYWLQRNAFLSSNPFEVDFYTSLAGCFVRMFSGLYTSNSYHITPIYAAGNTILVGGLMFLFVAGIIHAVRNGKATLIILTCTPVLLHLILSALRLYPFTGRFILYLLPGVILLCAAGFDAVAEKMFSVLKIKRYRTWLLVLIPVVLLTPTLLKFPIKKVEVKDGIAYMREHIRADECVYAGFAAPEVLFYYRDINFIRIEAPERIKNLPQQTDEWEKVRGRNWLLFGHNGEDTKTKETEILDRLYVSGYKKLKEYKSVNASVYLYDFGE
jgi:hypothetical protein